MRRNSLARLTPIIVAAAVLSLPGLSRGAEEPGLVVAENPALGIPTLKDLRLNLPASLGSVTFYGQNRFRWYDWAYFEPAGFDNSYDHAANQLRLGTRWDHPWASAHAAFQYAHVWNLPSGASAGAGTGALYFANGTLTPESHGTYLKSLHADLKDITGLGFTGGGGRFDYSSGNMLKADDPKIAVLKAKRIGERLIGNFGWSEYQRSFDGGYAAWNHEKAHLNVAALSPTQGGFEENAGRLIDDIDIIATELTAKKDALVPGTELQFFYYHYEDRRLMTASAVRHDNTGRSITAPSEHDVDYDTLGGHWVGVYPSGDGAFDAVFWGAYQTGRWFELSHEAYAVAAEGGYQWSACPWKPWLRGGYFTGSGDGDPGDGEHETFHQMLPTGRLYSSVILYNLMNSDDAFASLNLKPVEALSIQTEAHAIRLEDSADRWYVGSGAVREDRALDYTARPSGGEKKLGVLCDVAVSWKAHPQATLSAYYGHFFGSDVAEANYGQKKNADLFFAELLLLF